MVINTYTTISGDEWDAICYKHYGENGEMLMDKVMQVNPSHVKTAVFSAGVVLTMPVFDVQQENHDLPPWMR